MDPVQIKLVVSIVVYNPNLDALKRTTDSVRASKIKSQLVLIDNGLQDEVLSFANSIGAEYIRPSNNLGYGSAHNIAIRKYWDISQYHLILNPDVVIHAGCLEELVRLMDADQDIVLSSAKVLNDDGSLQRVHKRLPSLKILFGRRFSSGLFYRIWKREFDEYELKDFDLNEPLVIPNISGCFMFFRTTCLRQVSGFDERFFMYQEDIDLSRRARMVGTVVFDPKAIITHIWARGSHRKLKLTWMNIVSVVKYFLKWGFSEEPNQVLPYVGIGFYTNSSDGK